MTYPIGTTPDPFKIIERQKSRIDLLTQELMLATAKPYRGFWRGVAVGVALATLLAWTMPAFADSVSISGSTVTLQATDAPGAVAEVVFNNLSVNGSKDNGDYTLNLGDIVVSVTFVWESNVLTGADRITVSAPGYTCEPVTCSAEVLEGQAGRVLILEWVGM